MVTLQNIAYAHPNKDLLFDNINLTINKQDKIALIGNNGIGKSILLKIIAGHLQPASGAVKADSKSWYVPQVFGQFNDYSLARALQIDEKLAALTAILHGDVTEANLNLLNDDWGIEERCNEALAHWDLGGLDVSQKMDTLSGGQKTKVFLSGIIIHQPAIVLLDEPSNHLDARSRAFLYEYIQSTTNTLVVVSHDRTLLNILNTVCELSRRGIATYGGNYDFYEAQKALETTALTEDLKSRERRYARQKMWSGKHWHGNKSWMPAARKNSCRPACRPLP